MSDLRRIVDALIDGAPRAVVLIGSDDGTLRHDIVRRVGPAVERVTCLDADPATITASASTSDEVTALLMLGVSNATSTEAVDCDATSHACQRLLGVTCRRFPRRVVALVRPAADLSPTELLAFGFRKLADLEQGTLHEYCLSDYKQPPDWLNARYWANPERFILDEADEDASDEDDDDDDE